METATAKSFPAIPAARAPPQTAQLGEGPEQRGWGLWGWAFVALVSVVLTVRFGWDVYLARHSPRDLAFVIVTFDLTAVLCCCLAKLSLLRRDDPAAAPERRRVRIVVLLVSVALAIIIAARLALETPYLGMKIAVLVVAGVGIGLAFYFFARADARRQAEGTPLHKVSPEQRV
jgi:hypothetical protein